MFPVNNNAHSLLQTAPHSARNTTSSGSISQAETHSLSTAEYYAIWTEWEKNAPPGGGEKRDIAVARMRECLQNSMVELDLSELGLNSLPESLPAQIKVLKIHNNRLTSLPYKLPKNLRFLGASDNKLTSLPGILPKKLTTLGIANNQLQSLPESLPNSIEYINAVNNHLAALPNRLPFNLREADFAGNDIVSLNINLPDHLQNIYLGNNNVNSLPDNFPASLEYIDLHDNQLRTLPAAIAHLSPEVEIDAANNPFSERTLRDLMRVAQATDYTGARILFSMQAGSHDFSLRRLSESVKDWLPTQLTDSAWKSIEMEENAASFSAFLCCLGETRNTKENPAFKARIIDWLNRLAKKPLLRETTFAVAQGATTNCEDRVALAWNDMQKVALIYDVDNGVWDKKLPELISAGREMFRLELLEQAARDKVKTLHFVDEIEVYLAYQTELRDALNLTSTGERMRFRGISGVTQEDLDRVLQQVTDREKREFTGWLVQWTPWKTALRRANRELVQNIQEKQKEAFEDKYQADVDAVLKAKRLKGIPDAETAIGKDILDKIQQENDMALTEAFLQNRYRTLMAEQSPVQALSTVTELASVAASVPVLAAMAIRPASASADHPGSLLAATVAEGGMAPLARAWISLLHLLYQNKYLSKEETISALLPHKKHDKIRSLAHAIAGTVWRSEAATKLCALLSEVTGSDERLRQDIMARLSLEQPGYGFRPFKLDQPADFYKRAKHADKFHSNDAAKAQLKKGGLIPEKRELDSIASWVQDADIDRTFRREALSRWVATKGNWSGKFGDYARDIIPYFYPTVRLKINVLNAQGKVTSRYNSDDDRKTSGQVIELNLQKDHYSPVINGEQKKSPLDGDCFFYSFLTALNGKTPSETDIQRLRDQLANYILNNEEINDFIGADTESSDFDALQKEIKEEITPQVLASHEKMEREKTVLDRAKKSAIEKLEEINAREKKEKEERFDEMAASFAAHSEKQALQHDLSRHKKTVHTEKSQAQKFLENREKTPSWKGPVAHATTSLSVPRIPAAEGTSSTVNAGRATHEDIGQRLSVFSTARGESADEDIERRLNVLRTAREERMDKDIERRLKALRSRGESSNRQRAPALKKD